MAYITTGKIAHIKRIQISYNYRTSKEVSYDVRNVWIWVADDVTVNRLADPVGRLSVRRYCWFPSEQGS